MKEGAVYQQKSEVTEEGLVYPEKTNKQQKLPGKTLNLMICEVNFTLSGLKNLP